MIWTRLWAKCKLWISGPRRPMKMMRKWEGKFKPIENKITKIFLEFRSLHPNKHKLLMRHSNRKLLGGWLPLWGFWSLWTTSSRTILLRICRSIADRESCLPIWSIDLTARTKQLKVSIEILPEEATCRKFRPTSPKSWAISKNTQSFVRGTFGLKMRW